jgi:hypothetical protein
VVSQGLALGTKVRWSPDQASDPGFHDRSTALGTGFTLVPVDGVLGQKAAFKAQNRSVTLVEARTFRGNGGVQDWRDRRVQPRHFHSIELVRRAFRM